MDTKTSEKLMAAVFSGTTVTLTAAEARECLESYRAGLERAAEICDKRAEGQYDRGWTRCAEICAEFIRAEAK